MNKKIIIALSLVALLVAPVLALAQPPPPRMPGPIGSLWLVIVSVLNIIWPLFIGISILMFIVAGFIFLTAGGEPGKVSSAKNAVIWGVIGVIVGLLAFSLPYIIAISLGTPI